MRSTEPCIARAGAEHQTATGSCHIASCAVSGSFRRTLPNVPVSPARNLLTLAFTSTGTHKSAAGRASSEHLSLTGCSTSTHRLPGNPTSCDSLTVPGPATRTPGFRFCCFPSHRRQNENNFCFAFCFVSYVAQASLELTMWPKLVSDSQSPSLYLLSTGITRLVPLVQIQNNF